MEGQKGFTLFELVIGFCIITILAALAWPQVSKWRKEAEYRKVACDLISAMRKARSWAVASNLQHRVEVDLAGHRCRIVRGNRAFGSSSTSWDHNLVSDWFALTPGVIRANNDCETNSGTVTITFNPLGSSNSQYLCIMDSGEQRRFRVGVGYSATGRVSVSRWNLVDKSWE